MSLLTLFTRVFYGKYFKFKRNKSQEVKYRSNMSKKPWVKGILHCNQSKNLTVKIVL